jgi:UDP-N-acetyl-D-glucosamine dehydrogenase
LGVAYKKDVEDVRESPSLKLIKLLGQRGASLSYNDPYVMTITIAESSLTSVDLIDEILSLADCVVIATDHSCYDYKHIINVARLVFDTRGATKNLQGDNIIRL